MERLTRLPPDSFFGALVRAPLKLIPREQVVSVRAGVNAGARWIAGSSVHGCWLGTYESDKQALVAKLVKPGMTVWDVGANAGFYTLAFSRLVGPTGRVYAFEPLAENVRNLLTHVNLNDARNVVVVQTAVGARDDIVGFEVAPSNFMGRVSGEARSYLVSCLAADGFVAHNPACAPDLLKIDIEGGESAMLEGATRLLGERRPAIVLSLHGAEQGRRCRELLAAHGYSLFGLDGRPLANPDADEIYAHHAAGRP